MGKDLAAILADLAEHLNELVRRDDRLRDQLRLLARVILDPTPTATSRPETGTDGVAETKSSIDGESIKEVISDDAGTVAIPIPTPTSDPISVESPTVPVPTPPREPLRKLTLGQAQPRPESTPTTSASFPETEDELTGIEVRLRLKVEGLHWAIQRRRIETRGGDYRQEIAPRDHELLDHANAIRCQLWMNRPEFVVPADPTALENAARWFEELARAVELVRETEPDVGNPREHREPALNLLAEAQSALRLAVIQAGGYDDPDQFLAYQWLRSTTKRERIYIHRYMRLEDPANPNDPAGFADRVAKLASRLHEGRHLARKSENLFKKFRYHARQIAKHGGGDHSHDWKKMAEAVDGLIADGYPPSAIDLRELLLPILDLIPDDLGEVSPAFGWVLREVDAYLDTVSERSEPILVVEEPNEEVAKVARFLEGKTMVLIGGQCRRHARDAIRSALRLKDLDWISSREHTSIDRFEPNVARPEVALVLLAIRWSSHSYGEVKEFCDRHEKPMVRLPGGYGINQVANQILSQCSGQFRTY